MHTPDPATDPEHLANLFEAERDRLIWLSQRLLGVRADAEDAVQEGWLRLQRHGGTGIENVAGWLTTVVSRICLDVLRARSASSVQTTSWDVLTVLPDDGPGPGEEAELADSVALALLVVLDTLAPAERVALVLHDVFGLPFNEVADILGRSTDATKMVASRARGKIRAREDRPSTSAHQRRVVDAFRAAARKGDLDALLQVLDPSVVLHVDGPTRSFDLTGPDAVGSRAAFFAGRSGQSLNVLVAGLCGILSNDPNGTPTSLLVFTTRHRKIVRIDALADPHVLARMTLPT